MFEILPTIVDILVVAVLMYAAILLLKRTRSIFVFRGMITLVLVYFLANYFGLGFTVSIFQIFFSFFVIVIAVVFQREFRKFFENFSFSSFSDFFFRQDKAEDDRVRSAVVESVKYLAEKRIGAIIVFPGRQSIDGLIEGGFNLGGELSGPLLLSIFDPSSPGHDGAVIISENKLSRFGAHLPLAENIRAVKDFGTRHRAGMGLAERSDAFVILVSEEKGTVSIARDNKLETLLSPNLLDARLARFIEKTQQKEELKNWYSVFTFDMKYRILALAIAILLWYMLHIRS